MKFVLMIISYIVLGVELSLVFDLGFKEIMATTLIYYSWIALPFFIIANSAYLFKGFQTALGRFAGKYTPDNELGILYYALLILGVSAYGVIGAYWLLAVYLFNSLLNVLVVKKLRSL